MIRTNWHEYFMSIASQVASRATCERKSVGAVIVKDNRIIATGYNGAPAGLPHCKNSREDAPEGCLFQGRCSRAVHAEANALIQLAKHGGACLGAFLYVTCQPCLNCTKLILASGITEVFFKEEYSDPLAVALFQESKVKLTRI